MNELCRPVVINLLAQAVDVDLDQICLAVEMAIPDVFHNLTARTQFRCAEKQELEESKFFARYGNHFLAAVGAAAVPVELEVAVSKHGVAAMEPAPHERADAREKLGEHKRLCEVIIGSGIEAFDFLLDEAAGSEHQDWSFNAPLPQFAADFGAAHAR